MIALTWDRTWDLYIWALFTSPSGMNSALKIRRPPDSNRKTTQASLFIPLPWLVPFFIYDTRIARAWRGREAV